MPWVRLSSEHVRLPNGVEIPDFYRVDIAPYVSIFALTQDGQVALVEHYKHGPGIVSLELPAGYIENPENPLQDAQRELREETGLVSEDWTALGRYFIDGNRGCGWMYAFLARGAVASATQQLEDTELITLHFRPLAEVHRLWREGLIFNVTAMGLIGRALAELEVLKSHG